MLKHQLGPTCLLFLTLTILTFVMRSKSNTINSNSESKNIIKRPFQIQPIDITTVDRKVRPWFHDTILTGLCSDGVPLPPALCPVFTGALPGPGELWPDIWHNIEAPVKTREAREALEDRRRLRARVLQLEAEVEHLERSRALDIYNSLDRREGK